MKQHEWKALLSTYAVGEISERERELVEARLKDDPQARQELYEIRAVLELAGPQRDQMPEPNWQAMTAKIMAQISQPTRSQRLRSGLFSPPALAAAAALAALVVLWRWPEGEDASPRSQTAALERTHSDAGSDLHALADAPLEDDDELDELDDLDDLDDSDQALESSDREEEELEDEFAWFEDLSLGMDDSQFDWIDELDQRELEAVELELNAAEAG